jgi:hypothetical protein
MTIRLGLRTAVRRSLLIVSGVFCCSVQVGAVRDGQHQSHRCRYGPREVIPLILFMYLGVHV